MKPPAWRHTLTEVPRGAAGVARLALQWRSLREAPPGDGRPVMILPGLFNTDRSNLVLRRHLTRLGYRVEGWGLGRNLGQRTIGAEGELLFARIADLQRRTGKPVTLVGISLGGLMARIAARRYPERVRQVVTISSPYAGPPTATRVWRAYQLLSGAKVSDPAVRALVAEAGQPVPVPVTSIWSKSDGLVGGPICRDRHCNAVQVRSSHIWVQFNPEVLRAVASALGRERGFRPRGGVKRQRRDRRRCCRP